MLVVAKVGALSKHIRDDPIYRYFQSLEGIWRLERDYSDGSQFAGEAVFTILRSDVLLLSEKGRFLRPDGAAFTAGRDWQWCLAGPALFEICYCEASGGGLYHRLALQPEGADLVGEAEHLCEKDRYFGHYRFSPNRIDVHQKVRGPKKNYELKSTHTR